MNLLTTNKHVERFLSKLKISEVNFYNGTPCWEWQAAFTDKGYGSFKFKRKMWKAHRFAFEFIRGESLGELFACHYCDNPPCCNPDHLFKGTNYDNVQDMIRKGRQVDKLKASETAKRVARRGDAHPGSKIPDAELPNLVILKNKGLSNKEIANMYNVRDTCIVRILSGQRRNLFKNEK